MHPFEPVVSIESFHYAPIGSDWAALRLLAVIASGDATPRQAGLQVQCTGDARHLYPARAYEIERRLLAARRSDEELLWRASFELPIDLVQSPAAIFHLIAADGLELSLPAPGLRPITRQALAMSGYRERRAAAHRLRSTRGMAALATAMTVVATSSPAVALADITPAVPATTATTAPAPSTSTETAASTSAAASTPSAAAASPGTTTATTVPDTTTAAGTPQTSTTQGNAISPSHLVDSAPAAPARGSSASRPPRQVTQLFATASHAAGSATARPARKATGCATNARGEAVAYAAAGRAARLHCPAPTSGAVATGAQAAPGLPQGATLHIGPTATRPAPTVSPGTSTGTKRTTATRGPAGARRHRTTHHPVADRNGGAALARPVHVVSTHPAAPAPVTSLSPNAPGMLAPQAWTGTVTANPALTGAVQNLSGLLTDGNRPPSFLIPIYMAAGRKYNIPWEVLAAINAVETDYGRDLNTSTAGALGWMQFEPSTWKRWGVAADGHSVANPWDPRDAIFSAARYLAAAGAGQDITSAIFAYNHADWYVSEVLSRARAIAGHAQYEHAALHRGTFSVDFATGLRNRPTVSYRSSVLSHYDRLIAAANMVSAANFPYAWGGGHEQPARFGPFDCSGSVSYVIQQAGYKVPTTVSGNIPVWKFPTGPGRVTIFYNPTHTFMRIGNRFFGTSGFARGSGGAGWFDVDKLPAGYLSQFREVHVPGLGVNSFAPGQLPPLTVHRFHHRSATPTRGLDPALVLSSLGSFPRVS